MMTIQQSFLVVKIPVMTVSDSQVICDINNIYKFITFLDTVKLCKKEWALTDRKLHFILAKYQEESETKKEKK